MNPWGGNVKGGNHQGIIHAIQPRDTAAEIDCASELQSTEGQRCMVRGRRYDSAFCLYALGRSQQGSALVTF